MDYRDYVEDVSSGKVVVGELEKFAVERFLKDLQRDDLEFRDKEVKKAIKFIGIFKHYTGSHKGENFVMSPWQQFIVANIVGFYWKNTNRRRFTRSYIEIARKAGKTMFAVALAMYFLIADGEGAPEVLFAANSKDQSKIAFEMASVLAKQLDDSMKELVAYRDTIKMPVNNGKLKCLAADDSKLDGFNCSFGLVDEYHAAKDSKVYDVIRSSQGMRSKPHLMTITTAGFNKEGPCYKFRNTCCDILRGNIDDDSTFALIFSLDETDDWRDPSVWRKANPNMGITVFPEFLREQVMQATASPADEVGIKTKNFNIWCDSPDVWVRDIDLSKIMRKVDWSEFSNKIVYIGIDLSAVNDLTAVSYMTIDDNGFPIMKTQYYLPVTCKNDSMNAALYREWSTLGFLNLTQTNYTDYDVILNNIKSTIEEHKMTLAYLYYDSWNSTQFIANATALGINVQPFSQSIGYFNQPTCEMQRKILSKTITIDYTPITRFCFNNVALKMDFNGNVKPAKVLSQNKIDGVISMLMALGGYLSDPNNYVDNSIL